MESRLARTRLARHHSWLKTIPAELEIHFSGTVGTQPEMLKDCIGTLAQHYEKPAVTEVEKRRPAARIGTI